MDPKHAHADQGSGNLQKAASYASVCVALVLVGAKMWAWQETSSVSVLSSLVDSLLDVLAAGITVIGVRVALLPADSEHRFGHGKSEGLAALTQSVIISLSAVYVLYEAVQRLIEPRAVAQPEIGIGVMVISIALTIGLLSFQRYVVKRTGSMAINADAMHYRSDLLVNLGVIAALPLSAQTGLSLVDPLVGIGIAAYIIWCTFEIGNDALGVLLDRELPDHERARIEEAARQNEHVLGFHDLRTRFSGTQYFIQFHLELAPQTSLLNAHIIMDDVEDRVRAIYPRCEIIVHTDPLGFEEKRDDFD